MRYVPQEWNDDVQLNMVHSEISLNRQKHRPSKEDQTDAMAHEIEEYGAMERREEMKNAFRCNRARSHHDSTQHHNPHE